MVRYIGPKSIPAPRGQCNARQWSVVQCTHTMVTHPWMVGPPGLGWAGWRRLGLGLGLGISPHRAAAVPSVPVSQSRPSMDPRTGQARFKQGPGCHPPPSSSPSWLPELFAQPNQTRLFFSLCHYLFAPQTAGAAISLVASRSRCRHAGTDQLMYSHRQL